jgi:molybdopterin-guanine dinucleotide biosynthesis protein A
MSNEDVVAGVVLAGGHSTRMGAPKADLEWHGSTLLRRSVGVLRRAVTGPVVVVVGAPGQPFPDTGGAEVITDAVAGRGPLQGLATGLAALAERAAAAVVLAVDLPLLHPALVLALVGSLGDGVDAVVPVRGGRRQPLAAVYRTGLAEVATALLQEGPAGPMALLDRVRTRDMDEAGLLADPRVRAVDPEFLGLTDVDDPDTYRRLRALPPPLVTLRPPAGEDVQVRAADLGAALRAAGLAASAQFGADGWTDLATPLFEGDLLEVGPE